MRGPIHPTRYRHDQRDSGMKAVADFDETTLTLEYRTLTIDNTIMVEQH